MKPFPAGVVKLFAYVLYAVFLTAALLYVRFPEKEVAAFLQDTVRRMDPRIELSFDRLIPRITFDLYAPGPVLTFRSAAGPVRFRAGHLVLHPRIRGLFNGNPGINFELKFPGGGALEGRLVSRGDGPDRIFSWEITSKEIPLQEMVSFHGERGFGVQGRLSGDITCEIPPTGWMDGAGRLDLHLTGGRINFPGFPAEIGHVSIRKLEAGMTLARRALKDIHVRLSGPGMTGDLKGSVRLTERIGLSRLDLKGWVKIRGYPRREAAGGTRPPGNIPFTVKGTLERPRIRFLRS